MGKYKDAFLIGIALTIFLLCHMIVYWLDKRDEPEIILPESKPITVVEISEPTMAAEVKPEIKLESQTEPEAPIIVYYDVPLDHETQDLLRQACEESGVDMVLALAVISRETDFRNISGDNGNAYGYFQVWPKWHYDRMERLGVTDLNDPLGNFRVGCDFLAELLRKYPLADALTWYNSGKPGNSAYARNVIERMEKITAKGGV